MRDRNREAQRRTKDLADAGYLLRLGALPKPHVGSRPNVCTLTDKGRKYVQALGASVRPYFRPQEEKRAYENFPFMRHTLAAIDVLIAAERLCMDYDVSCPRMLTERDLKHSARRVSVPPGPNSLHDTARSVAVIPDGWFQLQVAGGLPVSIALELDRATEEQKVWRQKVAAYTAWAADDGPYGEAFETDNLTIAVVCPDERRRHVLIDWTARELQLRDREDFGELFVFTNASPVTTASYQFFFSPIWHVLAQREPVALVEGSVKATAQEETSGVVYQSL